MASNGVLAISEVQETPVIEVKDNAGFKGIFAQEDISKNSVIFLLKGTISTKPTKYTIQLGSKRHLTLPVIRRNDDDVDYCWQYLNHSCEPNGYINTTETTFRALRDIAAGEEITFNYLTTESAMAVPFTCACGSGNCFGLIRGRNFLTPSESKRLSRSVGEDNVVTLFIPAARKLPAVAKIAE
jgi:hypothetical protein